MLSPITPRLRVLQAEALRRLEQSIAECRECVALIGCGEKPCIAFNVYRDWMPGRVDVAFLSSAPMWKSFFYDDRFFCKDRYVLFNVLCVTSLEDFKASGFFYTTAVKCRTPKTLGRRYTKLLGATLCRRDKLLEKLCRICAQRFLSEELRLLAERGLRKLVVIGSTALQGLRQARLKLSVDSVRCSPHERVDRMELNGRSIDVLVVPDVLRWSKMLRNMVFRFVYYPPRSKLI